MTLDNSTNTDAEKRQLLDDKPRYGPNTSRWEYQANNSGNQTTKQTANSSSNNKTTVASIRVAVE